MSKTLGERRNITLGTLTLMALSLIAVGAAGQTAAPAPPLSTADRVAIQTFEKAKQDAQKTFNDAQQAENAVLKEWQSAHPGYHVNPQTFAVEADPKPEPPKK